MSTYDFVGGKKAPPKTNVILDAEKAHVQRINKTSTKEEIIAQLPLVFANGDTVKVKPNCVNFASEYTRIKDKEFIVTLAKMADLGDMAVEVLYLADSDSNPYLAKHFKKV